MSIEALKQALEALELNLPIIEDYGDKEQFNRQHKAIASIYDALRQTITQAAKQEPIAWMVYTLDGTDAFVTLNPADFTGEHRALPLYTTPQPKREWVGLTKDEFDLLVPYCHNEFDLNDYRSRR